MPCILASCAVKELFQEKKTIVIHKEETEGIACLGFDGKINVTLAHAGSTRSKIKEDHYVLVSFPSRSYVEHVVPGSGKADDTAREILSVITGSKSEPTSEHLFVTEQLSIQVNVIDYSERLNFISEDLFSG